MPRAPFRHRVVLLHGIRTDAPWFAGTQRQLNRFFETVPVPYPEYRKLGFVKLLVEPWVAGLAIATAGAIAGLAPAVALGVRRAWLAGGALAILTLAAHWRARRRLHRVRERVVEEYGERVREPGRRPHAIAHSLGSHALAAAMRKYTEVKFDRVVVCGAVLPRAFDWQALAARPQPQVGAVRNEQGLEDPIPRLAAIAGAVAQRVPAGARWVLEALSHLPREFGDAGRRGFVGGPDVVHSMPSQEASCPECAGRAGEPAALVHNVRLPFAHSDHFTGGLQCAGQWLPFLLGYDPAEHAAVMALCAKAHEADARGDYEERDRREAELRAQPWRWARGTLEGQAMSVLRKRHFVDVPDAFAFLLRPTALLAIGYFWRIVARAQITRDGAGRDGPDAGWDNILPSAVATLDLLTAFSACIEEAAHAQAGSRGARPAPGLEARRSGGTK